MGDYLLNMLMVATFALPFVLTGAAIADFFHTHGSDRERG